MNKKITEAFAKGKAFIPLPAGIRPLMLPKKLFMRWKKQVQI